MGANKQIGWSQESILLHGVSQQLQRLTGLLSNVGGSTAPLEFNPANSTVWNNGAGDISSNTSFGEQALMSNTIGVENTAFGYQALMLNTTGGSNQASYNTAVGWGALMNNIVGYNNTAIGDSALQNNTASHNTAVGAAACYLNTTGAWNTAVGEGALQNNQFGILNIAIGAAALFSTVGIVNIDSINGHRNIAIGSSALKSNTTGNGIAIGERALQNCVTGINNIAIGLNAGSGITGSGNVILATTGYATSGGGITSGNNNMILAPNTGHTTGLTTGSGNIIIGKVTTIPAAATNTITIADGAGNTRLKFDTNGQPSFNALHTAPATATSVGTTGEFRFTSTGIFLCIATNTWVKATLATF